MSHKKASGNDGFNNKKLLIDLSKVGGSNSGTNLKDKKDKREHSNNSDLTRDGKFWGISGPRPDYNELDENTSTEGHIQPITFEQCTQEHQANKLEQNQAQDSSQFSDQIKYDLPLSDIYLVKYSCLYDDNEEYCPVMVQITDQNLLKMNANMPYLLQVWDRKGQLLFERSLAEEIVNWNMSENVFVWQQNTTDNCCYMVNLREGQQPLIFTINFAGDFMGENDCFISNEGERLQIPLLENLKWQATELQWRGQGDVFDRTVKVFDSLVDENLSFTREKFIGDFAPSPAWLRKQQAEGDLIKKIEQGIEDGLEKIEDFVEDMRPHPNQKDFNNLNLRFSNQIIKRAPNKMIDFIDGHIVIAFQHKLYYSDLSKVLKKYKDLKFDKTHFDVKLTKKDVLMMDLEDSFKVLAINKIGIRQSALVVENLDTHQMSQLRIFFTDENNSGQKSLKLRKLGLEPTKTQRLAPIIKFRSVTKQTQDTKKYFKCGMVLRLDGSFEFYSDFLLTDRIAFPNMRCVDIETDMKKFYMKFVTNSLEIEDSPYAKFEDLNFCLMNVNHMWRTKISLNTLEEDDYEDVWKRIIDRRIQKHVKMFPVAKVLNMHALVAHKQYIQVFDMVQRHWLKPCDTYGLVRLMSIRSKAKGAPEKPKEKEPQYGEVKKKKKPAAAADTGKIEQSADIYKKFDIVVISRAALISFYDLDREGNLSIQDKQVETNGRIVQFREDPIYQTGLTFLVDNVPPADKEQFLYTRYNFDIVFSNNIEKNQGTKFTIQNYSGGRLQTLLSGEMAEILAHDCEFVVTFGSNNLFKSLGYSEEQIEILEDQIDEQDESCEIQGQTAYEYVKILYVQNKALGKVHYYPLIDLNFTKEGADALYVLYRPFELEIDPEELNEEGQFMQSFFLNGNDFGDKEQQFARISSNSIKTYSKYGDLEFHIQGLTFRNCIVIGSYLYIMMDRLENTLTSVDYLNVSEDELEKKTTWMPTEVNPGFYVYDINRLFAGSVESYYLMRTIAGQNNIIDFNRASQRFTFVFDLKSIVIIPFPHTNTINFIGMSQKSDYLIWRERNGFFTAVNRDGNMFTWTCISGKLLYIQYDHMRGEGKDVQGYQIYRSDKNDITYTQNFYSDKNRTISLICNYKSVSNEILETVVGQEDQNMQDNVLNLVNDDPTTKIQIKSTNFTRKNFHFKVISLSTYEDFEGNSMSQSKIIFHFDFPLFRKVNNVILDKFDWDLGVEPDQRLILSKDTKKLLEVINNQAAFVYYRRNINGRIAEDADQGQKVEWKLAYRVERYPRLISDVSSVPFLFSPNFDFIIDYEAVRKIFYVKNNRTGIWRCMIPTSILDIRKYDHAGNGLRLVASRICFDGPDTIRIINRFAQDCIYKIVGLLDKEEGMCELRLVSCVKIDNQFLNKRDQDEPHLMRDLVALETRKVADRLVRRNQAIKTAIGHAKQMNKPIDMFSMIFTVDYGQNWDSQFSKLDAEQSFTWLDWKIMDRVISDFKYDLATTDLGQTLQIALNLLPGGKSFLHKLASIESDSVDQTQNLAHAASMFKAARNCMENFFRGTSKGFFMEVPIFEDVLGLTALDYCLGIVKTPHPNVFLTHFKKKKTGKKKDKVKEMFEEMAMSASSLNPMMANLLLAETKDYSFMYAGDSLVNGIIEAIKLELPAVGPYLESRLVQSTKENPFLQSRTQRAIRDDVMLSTAADGDFGSVVRLPATNEKLLIKKMFEDDGRKEPYDLRYLDLPRIFQKNQQGYNFMNALETAPIEFFSNPIVQLVVETTWEKEWKFYITWIMRPLLVIELILFWTWSNILLVYEEDEQVAKVAQIGEIALIAILGLRLLFELIQFISAGKKYFQMAKYLDIGVPLLILFNAISKHIPAMGVSDEWFWRINAWCALMIWTRFLMALNSVQYFGWVIRICLDVLSDFMPFLIVYIFLTLAFADSFLALEQVLIQEGKSKTAIIKGEDMYERIFEPYVNKWKVTYFNSMAEFDMDFQEKLQFKDWIIFFFGTVLQVIVLLNLLIALVSETFARIFPLNEETSYQEKVKAIVQLQNTFGFFLQNDSLLMELLFVVKNPAIESKKAQSGVQSSLKKLENAQDEQTSSIDSLCKDMDLVLEYINAQEEAKKTTSLIRPQPDKKAGDDKKEKIKDNQRVQSQMSIRQSRQAQIRQSRQISVRQSNQSSVI